MRQAVIDVGSNSVLLAVEEFSDHWVVVHEEIAVTALGEGTKTTGLLGEVGMASTLEALTRFFSKAKEFGVAEPYAAATMAVRIASNAADFLDRAKAQDTPVHVLSGEDEAQLGFESVANDPKFANLRRISIIDPGGHSTEIVTAERKADGWSVLFRKSFPIGTLGLRSTLLPHERISPFEILRAVAEIDETIGMCYLPDKCGTCFVLGATGTNLITIRERMVDWQPELIHGAWLGYEEISKAFGHMAPMSDEERSHIIGLEPGREKTIHIGALILERFLFGLRSEGCFVSVRGWRHALLEKMAVSQIKQETSADSRT